MLVLSRKSQETIVLDGRITITVVEVRGNQVRLGIEAPKDVSIQRAELRRGHATREVPLEEMLIPLPRAIDKARLLVQPPVERRPSSTDSVAAAPPAGEFVGSGAGDDVSPFAAL
ncbi:MAG: carbon storage regulator [Planctomycetaceae bacterium]|nr:carbon storage regulator [Planctomycetaceae bacterium]